MQDNQGVTPSGPGSRASHDASKLSSPKASIPNAGEHLERLRASAEAADAGEGISLSAASSEVTRTMLSVLDPEERRLKIATELTLQRRINEHARDRAKRELQFAERELARIDDEFMRFVVDPVKAELAQGIEARQRHDREAGHGPQDESPVANGDAPNA